MSSLVAKIRRFQIIIQTLEKGNWSKSELIERCAEEGFEVSNRTFDRDIEDLRRDFNLDLEYDSSIRAYRLMQSSQDASRLKQILELSQEVQALQAGFFTDAALRDRVQLEPFSGMGTEYMDILTKAINQENIIRFKHFNYRTEQYTDYEVYPLLLKEYGRRWYLYAWVEARQDCRTFGLDRIDKVEMDSKTFDRNLYSKNTQKFRDVIGLNYSDRDEPVRVLLKCTRLQAWYLESAPWHSTMTRIEVANESKEGVYFELRIIPNYELKQKILSMVDQIEVVEPLWLREEMDAVLKKMQGRYQ